MSERPIHIYVEIWDLGALVEFVGVTPPVRSVYWLPKKKAIDILDKVGMTIFGLEPLVIMDGDDNHGQ